MQVLSFPALVLTFRDLPKLFLPNVWEVECHVSIFDEVSLKSILDGLRLASRIISRVDEVEKVELWSTSITVDFLSRQLEKLLQDLNLSRTDLCIYIPPEELNIVTADRYYVSYSLNALTAPIYLKLHCDLDQLGQVSSFLKEIIFRKTRDGEKRVYEYCMYRLMKIMNVLDEEGVRKFLVRGLLYPDMYVEVGWSGKLVDDVSRLPDPARIMLSRLGAEKTLIFIGEEQQLNLLIQVLDAVRNLPRFDTVIGSVPGKDAEESFLVLLNLEEDYCLKISVSGSLKNIKFIVAPGTLFSIEARRCSCSSRMDRVNTVKVSVLRLASKDVSHEIEVVLPRTGKREAAERSIAVLDKLAGTSLDSLVHEVKRELERLMEEQASD